LIVNRLIFQTALKPVAVPVAPVVGGNFPLVLGDKVSLGMIWCPPTSPEGFRMGSLESEAGRYPDERAHQVMLTKGFWLGRTQVTQTQWKAVMGTNNPSRFKGVNRPVEKVSWDDSMEFCWDLTQSECVAGRVPAGYEYTLPTESQWEYACRAGTTYDYSQLLDAMGWHEDNSDWNTHPVGLKQSNGWGLYDMHGNVNEWCRDWYAQVSPAGPSIDPIGPTSGAFRVLRGGGWIGDAALCRSAYRNWYEPGGRLNDLGFRLALAPQVRR
jgi:formylglycine-generating enzyme required for sulfatase activity